MQNAQRGQSLNLIEFKVCPFGKKITKKNVPMVRKEMTMIVEQEYQIKLSEIGKENKITNKAILGDLEDIGGIHSNIAGYGILDIQQTKLSWVLLDWKLKIIRRPKYSEKIKIKTWSKNAIKFYTYRDFEVYDENGQVIAIATSKWVLLDIDKGKIVKISDEVLNKYEPELEKSVFDISEIEKLQEPENYISEVEYTVKRSDIDVNHHMHNLNYLELANEVLPEDVYNKQELNNVRINYKKEIKLGETVKCKYSFENDKHIIVIKNKNDSIVHAIIELK